jgi:hypothetical protein
MDERKMDNKTFWSFVVSLKPIIEEMIDKYGVELVYSANKKSEAAYWNVIKSEIDKGEDWMFSRMHNEKGRLDRHKYSALMLAILIKNPLFKPCKSGGNAGCYTASMYFALDAAILLLGDFIVDEAKDYAKGKENYIEHVKEHGVFPPEGDYMEETLRTFHTLFRPFKKRGKRKAETTFPEMDDDNFPCSDRAWGVALLLANNMSLIESYSIADYERGLLYKNFKKNKGKN